LRNLRLEEIRQQPHLDAFELANLDGLLDLAEIGVLGAEDDAIGGVLVQQVGQALDGGVVEVEFGDDFDLPSDALLQLRFHARGILVRADDEEASLELLAAERGFAPAPDGLLLGQKQQPGDGAEEDDDGAGQLHLEEEEQDDDAQHGQGAGLARLPRRLA
jgi:hypothetical protein